MKMILNSRHFIIIALALISFLVLLTLRCVLFPVEYKYSDVVFGFATLITMLMVFLLSETKLMTRLFMRDKKDNVQHINPSLAKKKTEDQSIKIKNFNENILNSL